VTLILRLLETLGRWLGMVVVLLLAVVLADVALDTWTAAMDRQAERDRLADEVELQRSAVDAAHAQAAEARTTSEQESATIYARATEGLRVRVEGAAGEVAERTEKARDLRASWTAQLADALDPQRLMVEQLEDRTNRACTGPTGPVLCGWTSMEEELARRKLDELTDTVGRELAPLRERLDEADEVLTAAREAHDELLTGELPITAAEATRLAGTRDRAASLQAEADVSRAELEASQRELAFLEQQSGISDEVLRAWREHGVRIVLLATLLLAMPYLRRALWYLGLMPLVERRPPLRLVPADAEGQALPGPSEPELPIEVPAGGELFVRSQYVARERGRPRTKFVYGGWRHPFTSAASGLIELEWFRPEQEPITLTLGNTRDPDSQLLRLDLREHPGFVVHPSALVALTGGLRLRRRWQLFRLHAWLTFQLRFVLVEGTGSVFVEGRGVVSAEESSDALSRVGQERVLGFDGRLDCLAVRARPFWPILVGRRGMVDDGFRGAGLFLLTRTEPGKREGSALRRLWSGAWGAVEKALGIG
jgi:hypothetical protein